MRINYNDIVGCKYNKLTVISIVKLNNKNYASCLCDCGNTIMCIAFDLLRSHTKSCGCHKSKSCKERSTKHGMSHHPLTPIYSAMIQRCTNIKNKRYMDYGGRGINVCDEWINDINNFFDWALSNGWKNGLELDRKDNNKGYSPDNCRLVTAIVNQRNKRNNILITYKGETKSLPEWCECLGLSYSMVMTRLKREKLTTEQAFERPARYKPTPTK